MLQQRQKEVISLGSFHQPRFCLRRVRQESATLRHGRYVLPPSGLLHLEGEAVGALTYCGISLMCADLYLVKGAVILAAAVVLAIVDSTADVLVCIFSSHISHSFHYQKYGISRRDDIICTISADIQKAKINMVDTNAFL